MVWISVLFLAAAVSFDALAIGVSYGMNRISISFWPKIVLSSISGCLVFATMQLGQFLNKFLAPRFTSILGGLIFVMLGLYNIWRNYRAVKGGRILFKWHIPVLGLIIQVFQEPLAADCDQSKHITGAEAVILGGALALDALAAGVAAAILNLPPFYTALAVSVASFLFITQGIRAGEKLPEEREKRRDLRWIPGVLIILIGILKFFF